MCDVIKWSIKLKSLSIFCLVFLGNGKYDRRGASLVSLGQKVFALGGGYNPATTVVEEYIDCATVWNKISQKMRSHRRHFGAISVPASMFKDLEGGCGGL